MEKETTELITEDIDKRIMQIGLNIAFYRKQTGLTQDELAAKIFITPKQLSRIEAPGNQYSTSISTLLAISDALGIEPKQLFEFR